MQRLNLNQINFLWVILLMILSIGAIQSCETLGYENVDTTRKSILVANAEIRAGNLLLQDLIAKRAVTRSQANSALKSLQLAKDQLQTALSAVDAAGDPVLAKTNFDKGKASLGVAMALLAPLVEI